MGTNFSWLETNLCTNCISDNRDLLIALVDHLLNIIKEFKNLEKTGNLNHTHKNKLNKACFDNDAAYSDSKDLGKRTVLDKILKDKPL